MKFERGLKLKAKRHRADCTHGHTQWRIQRANPAMAPIEVGNGVCLPRREKE